MNNECFNNNFFSSKYDFESMAHEADGGLQLAKLLCSVFAEEEID